jgi:collagenase-like PrtC family protease
MKKTTPKKRVSARRKEELEELFESNYASWKIEGMKLSSTSKARIKKLWMQDLSGDEMLEILMDDILSGKLQ